METKSQHTSLDLLIHPGETILEILEDRQISQKELATRTGFTEKHISTVITGHKSISAEFAMKLEYPLGIPASFWRNLQMNYDLEVVNINERYNITAEEERIAKEIRKPTESLNGKINSKSGPDLVYKLRQLFGVSSLSAMSALNSPSYRTQFSKNTSDNIMYIWQYLTEKKVENQTIMPFDVKKLEKNLDRIKNIMHDDPRHHIDFIREVLNECGILFTVMKDVEKTPIKGMTVKTTKNQVMIALTIKGRFVDIFWFTLFHEIAHVINGDYRKKQTIREENSEIELRADRFAADTLIDRKAYKNFVETNDFSILKIEEFAKENNVLKAIVLGRLMKEEILPWNSRSREKYIWNDEV